MSEQHWGHGFAVEAASAVINFGFEVQGLKRVVAVADTANESSIRVMQRLGLAFDGREITPEFDRTSYSITSEKWREQTAQGLAPSQEGRSEVAEVFEVQSSAVFEPVVETQRVSQE